MLLPGFYYANFQWLQKRILCWFKSSTWKIDHQTKLLTNFRYKECCPCIYKLAYLVDYRLRLRKQGVWEISKSKSHKSTRKVDWKYLTKWWKTTTLIWKSIFSSFFVGEVGFGQLSEDPYKFHIATSSSNCPYETSLPGVWFAHWF